MKIEKECRLRKGFRIKASFSTVTCDERVWNERRVQGKVPEKFHGDAYRNYGIDQMGL